MAHIGFHTSNTQRRIAGVLVQIEAEYDGVQRRELISNEAGYLGHVCAARPMRRHEDIVYAYHGPADARVERRFPVNAWGTKGKALTAARRFAATGGQ